MRKFFDKLANAGRRVMRWLGNTAPVRFFARCYDQAVVSTAKPVLTFFYGKERRAKYFNHGIGYAFVVVSWEVVILATTAAIAVWRGTKAVGRGVRKATLVVLGAVLAVTAVLWAVLSIAFTVVLALVTWALNAVRNMTVRGVQVGYAKAAGVEAPQPLTRYATFREVLAYDVAVLTRLHAGVARLSRRVIGDRLTHYIVTKSVNAACHLHPPTYDYFFGAGYPYGTPVDEGDTFALYIQDVPSDWHLEPEISETEKAENWFLSNGYVLIATDAPDKSDTDVFNEYMRERWANLNAAEIATDEYGRTWVVPFRTEPLFKDVALSAETSRLHADKEIGWMTIDDKVAKSHAYGRHWAAALTDQNEKFLADGSYRTRERARLYTLTKGRSDLHVEHILKGFDEWVTEHISVPA